MKKGHLTITNQEFSHSLLGRDELNIFRRLKENVLIHYKSIVTENLE